MCGIVGLHLRDATLAPQLGPWLAGMLDALALRGPDSAGVGIYGDPRLSPAGMSTVCVLPGDSAPPGSAPPDFAPPEVAAPEVAAGLVAAELGGGNVSAVAAGPTLVLSAPVPPAHLVAAVGRALPAALVVSHGHDLAVLKGAGHPSALVEAFGLRAARGWQGLGHTRMATESAVTSGHSHPFAIADDLCLVHNGSFSNHATIRRELIASGARFDSDNDSEVAARFVAAGLAGGDDLDKALRRVGERFDGFYTLLVTTADQFAVTRDAIAGKPALIAETPAWVAMASEYAALTVLPGIERARVFEPEPEEVYLWSR